MLSENEIRQKEYFDELARKRIGSAASVSAHNFIFGDIDAVLNALPVAKKILEIGCGDGSSGFTEHFVSKGRHVSFMDISAESVRVLETNLREKGYKDFRPLAGTFSQIAPQMAGETFDVIFFGDTLHHLTETETSDLMRDLVPFMHATTKVVGFEPNGNWPLWPVMPRFNPEYIWEVEKNVLHCTPEGFARKFGASGLKLDNYIYQRIVPLSLMDRSAVFVALNRLLVKIPLIKRLSSYTIVVASRAGQA